MTSLRSYGTDIKESDTSSTLGFGDLCRYFYRTLKTDHEDYVAHNLAGSMVECWRRNKYLFSELEELFFTSLDQHLLARELANTLADNRGNMPEGISCTQLVKMTSQFFRSNGMINKYKEQNFGEPTQQRIVLRPGVKREKSASPGHDVEIRPKKKMSKFDSLKPISNYLENLLVTHGLSQHQADLVVLDIVERFVTAGFGWDKVLQYHAKVIYYENFNVGAISF